MANSLILTSGGIALVRDFLAAPSRDYAPQTPQFIVCASGNLPVSRFVTSLPGETFRAPIVKRDVVGNGIIFYAFLGPGDNNQSIYAYGIMAGNDATSVVGGAGTLIAVANEANPFGKNAVQTFTIPLQITVSGNLS